MGEDALGVGGGRRHEEALGAEAGGCAVVEGEAVLAQHQAVARAAGAEVGEAIDVEAVEENADVGAGELDLAEGGDV